MKRWVSSFWVGLPFLVLAACSTTPPEESPAPIAVEPPVFPRPAGLEPQIEFWRHVFAVWHLDQVALHDDEHMNLVYEVIDLPPAASDHYSRERRRFVRTRQDALAHRLRTLERKRSRSLTLTAGEQALEDKITAVAGAGAIYGASSRLRSQRGLRERFKRGLEISGRYDGLFRQVFREAGLPEDFAYLPHVESSFQLNARSSAGAVGMWQFTRPAAQTYMNTHPALDERLDPVASARGAARYLNDAYDRLGDWALAVTSYNHGIGGMKRAKRHFGTDFVRIVREYQHPYFGFASRNFYAEFLAVREIARDPEVYFPEGIAYERPLDWDRVVLRRATAVPELAFQFNVHQRTLTHMNPAWTRAARSARVSLPAGTEVWLPAGTLQTTAYANNQERAVAVSVQPEAARTPQDVSCDQAELKLC